MTTDAGEMTRRVAFQSRADDANGDPLGDWTTQVTRDAKIMPLKARQDDESVMQQRLQGSQPVVIIVRRDSTTKTIDNAWRAVDARNTDTVFSISSAIWNEAEGLMEFLAVQRRGGPDA